MGELETKDGRVISAHQVMAEEAADALVAALKLAGLPALPSLSPVYATGHVGGGHVDIGGANARTVMAIAQYIAEHAECQGRVTPGRLVRTVKALAS